MSMSVFTGWPADATTFFAELAEDNTKEFWVANRHRYAAAVRAPLVAMAGALEGEFGALRILRPYIDRRFRPAGPPLRLDTGAVGNTPEGTERSVVLSATALTVRVGHYLFDAAQLRRFRAAVVQDAGAALPDVLAAVAAAGLALGDVPRLVSRPKGFQGEHPRMDLLRLRALHVGRSWPAGSWLGTPEPLARVAGAWRAARPLVEWLDEHVGPSAKVT
ncbi:DUF2461 family protein [Pseudonocardia sp. TRM90224]|uniref:DUF2461 family protein n=1 Tax=Pseudonocardia sp. TRM90224 TaxID=2812678 RepID=UPI001E35934E|nr:DUF2461 family protein [Pseudonocardia sp. TRM90224]